MYLLKPTLALDRATYPLPRAPPREINFKASLRVVLYPAGSEIYSFNHSCTLLLLVETEGGTGLEFLFLYSTAWAVSIKATAPAIGDVFGKGVVLPAAVSNCEESRKKSVLGIIVRI